MMVSYSVRCSLRRKSQLAMLLCFDATVIIIVKWPTQKSSAFIVLGDVNIVHMLHTKLQNIQRLESTILSFFGDVHIFFQHCNGGFQTAAHPPNSNHICLVVKFICKQKLLLM